MAGHSKWANTKHRKAAQDAKRGKIFTKIIRELVTAARLGGGDPASNPRLRAAVDKALSNNMTRDTLNRAIARGVGGDEAGDERLAHAALARHNADDVLDAAHVILSKLAGVAGAHYVAVGRYVLCHKTLSSPWG